MHRRETPGQIGAGYGASGAFAGSLSIGSALAAFRRQPRVARPATWIRVARPGGGGRRDDPFSQDSIHVQGSPVRRFDPDPGGQQPRVEDSKKRAPKRGTLPSAPRQRHTFGVTADVVRNGYQPGRGRRSSGSHPEWTDDAGVPLIAPGVFVLMHHPSAVAWRRQHNHEKHRPAQRRGERKAAVCSTIGLEQGPGPPAG